jgi:hypothetical protein
LNLKKRRITWIPLRTHTRRCWIAPWGTGYMHSAQSNRKPQSGQSHSAYHANVVGPLSGCRHITYGHSHTFQSYRSPAGFTADCSGFLGNFDADDPAFDYDSGPNTWTLGVLYESIYLRKIDPVVSITQIPIVDGRTVVA